MCSIYRYSTVFEARCGCSGEETAREDGVCKGSPSGRSFRFLTVSDNEILFNAVIP